jgi:HK97 family phage major capsid protein
MDFDANKLAADLAAQMGEKLGPLVAEAVNQKVKDAGLDRVDRKHAMFPSADDRAMDVAPGDRAREFLKGALFGRDSAAMYVRKALEEGQEGAGGYLVPAEYRGELLRRATELSDLFPHVRKIPVIGDSGEFPKLAQDVAIAWGRTENEDIASTDPVLDHLTWNVRNMSAITYMSRELADDSNPGIVQIITDLFSEAIAAERDKMIAVGNGDTQPAGIYSAAGLGSVAVDGELSYAKIVTIKYRLARKYHRNAAWIMNSTNLHRCVAMEDDNGQPLLRDALPGPEPTLILGKPVRVQEDLPDDAVFFGDLNHYFWFDRQRLLIESTSTGGDTFRKHQLAIKVVERCDGKLALAEAFVKGTGITS